MTGCRPNAKDLLSEFPPPTTFDQDEPPLSPVIYEAVPDSSPPSPSYIPPQAGSPLDRSSDTMEMHFNGGMLGPEDESLGTEVGMRMKQSSNQTRAELNGNVKGKDVVNGNGNEVGVASRYGKLVFGIPPSNGGPKEYQNQTKVPVSNRIMASNSRNGIGRESPPPARHTDSGFADGENHSQNQIRSPIAKNASQTLPKSKIPQRQVSGGFQTPGIKHGNN